MGSMHRSVVTTASTSRLKREDCKRTKHDSAFSHWKILIGPNDWEDYLLGKEGAEKYRTQNLPNCVSCSGIYELGIASWQEASRLDPHYIVPVYVGKSDNVRTRLQRYGREGAHLENGHSNSELHFHEYENVSASKRAGLFTDAFSRGFSIVYRWAPMNDNKDAERTEAQLLNKFDYAWNKGCNVVRRHNDALRKLDDISRASPLPAFIRKLQLSLEKQKGVRIKVCEPLLLDSGSDFHDNFKSTNFLPQVFKFGQSQPRRVSLSLNGYPNTGCGVSLGHGSVCLRPPIKGNKRCAEHKGMKVNGVNIKLTEKEPCTSRADPHICNAICGVHLDGGISCTRQPAVGRKRCEEHKGMRIKEPISKELGAETPNVFAGPTTKTSSWKKDWHIGISSVNHAPTCGATLRNGSFCRRKASQGNKRCWQHTGMKS